MKSRTILFIPLIILQTIAFIINSANYSVFALSIIFALSVVYCLQEPAKRSALLAFDVSFFILLLSRIYIPYIYNIDRLTYQSDFVIDKNLLPAICNQLAVALLSVNAAYSIFEGRAPQYCKNDSFHMPGVIALRSTAKKLSIILSFFFLYKVYGDIVSNFTYGYMSLYDGSSAASTLLTFTAGKFNFCMYMFFATMPSKKECTPMLWLFVIANALTIFTGQRSSFLLPLIFFILYLTIRNYVNSEGEVWLSRRNIITIALISPILMISMYVVMVLRAGATVHDLNPFDGLLSSIYQLGSSIEVINNSISYQNILRQQHFYSLSEFYDFLVHNPISSLLFDVPRYAPGTIELATHGKSLGNALTYLDNPTRFFNYGSVGSSYISEAWLDFGYFGIIAFSILYGYILSHIWKAVEKNVWVVFCMFVVLTGVIYAPRYSASSFLVDLIETKSWPYLLLFYMSYRKNS